MIHPVPATTAPEEGGGSLVELDLIERSLVQNTTEARERSGSEVDCLTLDWGLRVRASPASLRCGP